jgi:hypothetical protein
VKLFLDNCVPYRARRLFLELAEVTHAADTQWRELKNGELLHRVSAHFDLFVTVDKKMRFEHRLDALPVPVLVLDTLMSRFQDLERLEPYLLAALTATKKWRFVQLSSDGTIDKLAPRG